MNRRIFSFLFIILACTAFSQSLIDSISRKPPLRGKFRWILSPEMYEEGDIINNIKTGDWMKYYQGNLSGKTVYKSGLALAEYWNYKNEMKLRYSLSEGLDTLTVCEYDMEGKIVRVLKSVVDIKTASLNYSLLSDDTLFKKTAVTEVKYVYELWTHRNDMLVVTETTAGISNKKYFALTGKKYNLVYEINDKGDFMTGKKKDFLKEEEKSKKFLDEKSVPKNK